MMGGVCQYFVNEITRLYEADFFAEWLSQPRTHIYSLLLETYRIAKGLVSERDNILKLGYDIDSSANQAYAAELHLSSTGK
jgi:hypothetical protein